MFLLNQMLSILWKNRKTLRVRPGSMMPVLSLLAWLLHLSALGQDPYLLGIARLQEESYDQARNYFEQVLATDSDDPEGLLKIAETYYLTADYPNAIAYLEQLENLRVGMGSYPLARTYANMGDAGMAAGYLEEHLRSEYKLPSSTILLDDAFLSIETSSEWRSLWKKDWYTEDELLFQEITYLTNSEDYLDALDLIGQALDGTADRATLLIARGRVFHRLGNYQNSIKAYTAAIELTRTNAESFYGRAASYLALGKFRDAIPDLKRTVQLQPEKLEILKELSEANRAAGDFDQAAAVIEDYIAYFPEQAEAHYMHGQVHYESGKYLKALSSFNLCLELETNDPRFYAARGKTYLATSTYRYALNDFGMALDLDPKNHEVWFQRGMAKWQSNEREGAIADWERATRYGSEKAAEKLMELSGRQ
jgi:tetratricopeptide (TPR) repeat protein